MKQPSGKSDLPPLKVPPQGEWRGQVVIAERQLGYDVTVQCRGMGIRESFPDELGRVMLAWGELCHFLKSRGVDVEDRLRTLPTRDYGDGYGMVEE